MRSGFADQLGDWSSAAPAARTLLVRALARGASQFGSNALRLLAYSIVATSILALPGSQSASAPATTEAKTARAASVTTFSFPQPLVAREVLGPQRAPVTVTREAAPEVKTYVVQDGDNLVTIAAHFGVDVLTVAYNNDITDPHTLQIGQQLRIPPMDAAIYAVKAGDTVEKVAAHFKVDLKIVMDTNRLYFEPENFAPGKTILVPVAEPNYPGFELKQPVRVAYVARAQAPAPAPVPGRRLAWPVGGVITQYFWYAHNGVDIGAPFGAGVAAADEGTVTADGWVPVGGLRVCVRHDWGMETCYYHLSASYVDPGQRVKRGQIIGAIGLTGVTTGPHVHWEARLNGVLVNPLAY